MGIPPLGTNHIVDTDWQAPVPNKKSYSSLMNVIRTKGGLRHRKPAAPPLVDLTNRDPIVVRETNALVDLSAKNWEMTRQIQKQADQLAVLRRKVLGEDESSEIQAGDLNSYRPVFEGVWELEMLKSGNCERAHIICLNRVKIVKLRCENHLKTKWPLLIVLCIALYCIIFPKTNSNPKVLNYI